MKILLSCSLMLLQDVMHFTKWKAIHSCPHGAIITQVAPISTRLEVVLSHAVVFAPKHQEAHHTTMRLVAVIQPVQDCRVAANCVPTHTLAGCITHLLPAWLSCQ